MAGSVAPSDREAVSSTQQVAAPPPVRHNGLSGPWISVIVLTPVAVVLAVLALVQSISVRNHDDRYSALNARRTAAVSAASDEVAALLTVRHATASSDLKRLLNGSTAAFHDQLEKQAKTFQQALTAGNVTSTGSIAAAALVSMGGNTAVVAIAAKATVTNKASPKGEPRNYRLTVTVAEVGGRWLVSGLTFVV